MGIRRSGQRTGFYLPHRWLSSTAARSSAQGPPGAHEGPAICADTAPEVHHRVRCDTTEGSLVDTSSREDVAAGLLSELQLLIDERDRAGAVALALDAVARGRITVPYLYTLVLGPYLARDRLIVVARRGERVGGAPGLARGPHDHRGALPHRAQRWRPKCRPPARPSCSPALPGSATRSDCGCCPIASSSRAGTSPTSAPTRRCSTSSPPRTRRAPSSSRCRSRRSSSALSCAASSTRCAIRLPGVRIVVGGPAFSRDRNWPAEDLLDPAELGLPGSRTDG